MALFGLWLYTGNGDRSRLLGRLDRDSEIPRVSDGTFEIHMETDVDPASIMCENCGGCDVRLERQR